MDATPFSYRVDPPRPELGALLASVAMLVADKGSVILSVTAACHGEGTTTVARELAAAAARPPWCRVAFVDASPAAEPSDLPSLLDAWERGQDPVLRPGRIGTAEIALGRIAGLGGGAAGLETLGKLFTWLRSQFTIVVVDCPPVLPHRQAALATTLADGTLLVVEAERTRRADIEQARTVLQTLGATMLGVVLNKRQDRVPRFVEKLL